MCNRQSTSRKGKTTFLVIDSRFGQHFLILLPNIPFIFFLLPPLFFPYRPEGGLDVGILVKTSLVCAGQGVIHEVIEPHLGVIGGDQHHILSIAAAHESSHTCTNDLRHKHSLTNGSYVIIMYLAPSRERFNTTNLFPPFSVLATYINLGVVPQFLP